MSTFFPQLSSCTYQYSYLEHLLPAVPNVGFIWGSASAASFMSHVILPLTCLRVFYCMWNTADSLQLPSTFRKGRGLPSYPVTQVARGSSPCRGPSWSWSELAPCLLEQPSTQGRTWMLVPLGSPADQGDKQLQILRVSRALALGFTSCLFRVQTPAHSRPTVWCCTCSGGDANVSWELLALRFRSPPPSRTTCPIRHSSKCDWKTSLVSLSSSRGPPPELTSPEPARFCSKSRLETFGAPLNDPPFSGVLVQLFLIASECLRAFTSRVCADVVSISKKLPKIPCTTSYFQ